MGGDRLLASLTLVLRLGDGVIAGAGQDWAQGEQTTLLFIDFVDFFFFFACILGTTVWVSQAVLFPLG